jgi:hypothetical protein
LRTAFPSVTCYYAKGGGGVRVAPAFAVGCGGRAQRGGVYHGGAAALYGVKSETYGIWQAIRLSRARWFYLDNAYFGRGRFYRVTEGAIQHSGLGDIASDTVAQPRWQRHGLRFKDWRRIGDHILVCDQSDAFLKLVGGVDPMAWRRQVRATIGLNSDRPLVWRSKGSKRALSDDLRKCWAVVTYTSNCAIDALLAGVPIFVLGPSAARPMGQNDLSLIEQPLYPDNREEWAAVLAANQWTLEEMRSGQAWSALNGIG